MDIAARRSLYRILALVALLGSTAAAFMIMPIEAWSSLAEPTARAALLMLVTVVSIVLLRIGGASGALERGLLCVLLASMPAIYVESGVWHEAGPWLLLELAGLVTFASWAWFAYRRDPLVLALGIAAHGLLWDSWHHDCHYIASWYASACLVVDLGAAVYVALSRERLTSARTDSSDGPPDQSALLGPALSHERGLHVEE
jgi:hypothetical protein